MPKEPDADATPLEAQQPAESAAARSAELPAQIDLADEAAVKQWCEHFGITPQQLEEAVGAVGTQLPAVREHLLNQGASSGVG